MSVSTFFIFDIQFQNLPKSYEDNYLEKYKVSYSMLDSTMCDF